MSTGSILPQRAETNHGISRAKEGPSSVATFHEKALLNHGYLFSWSEIVNFVIQIIGVIAALIFGVWAARSYNVAQTANSKLSYNSLGASNIQSALLCSTNAVSDIIVTLPVMI